MNTKISINLPVADLPRSLAFWKALGYGQNPEFTGDGCGCIIISDEIQVMVMTHDMFLKFSPKAICDSRKKVDDMVAKAIAAGGSTFEDPEDHGFMYSHSFIDPDGHGWGLAYMNTMPPK